MNVRFAEHEQHAYVYPCDSFPYHSKSYELIIRLMKLSGNVGNGPRNRWLHFGGSRFKRDFDLLTNDHRSKSQYVGE